MVLIALARRIPPIVTDQMHTLWVTMTDPAANEFCASTWVAV